MKCKECVYYDGGNMQKFTPKGPMPTSMGWCSKKSVYPAKAPDGMMIPPDAVRGEEGEDRSKPFIVVGDKVHLTCREGLKK